MNKGLLYGLGAALLAGVGYGIYKSIDKHIKNELEKGFEEVKNNTTHKDYKTSTEEYVDELFQEEKDLEESEENTDNDFLNKMMEEEKEAEEATKNWSEREERCRKEMSEKVSLKDQNMFTDNVSEYSEFEALNKIREASGKEPLKVSEQFEKFLGKDSENKSVKESLDNIAENIKKDPKLKKKILDALSE
mgnify:CR=1 FL=1